MQARSTLLGDVGLESAPMPTTEIGGKFDGLGGDIDTLYHAACQLNQRLNAVLASESPQIANEAKCQTPQNSCHMADKLDELRTRVNGTAAVLHSILNRLAL